jgi:hypothetical protein
MRKDRLLAKMKNRNVADEYCNYVDMILTQRQIHLKFDDQLSDPFSQKTDVAKDVPYPCSYTRHTTPPSSVWLNQTIRANTVGFVDDTTLITTGRTFDETHNNIKDMIERKDGLFD